MNFKGNVLGQTSQSQKNSCYMAAFPCHGESSHALEAERRLIVTRCWGSEEGGATAASVSVAVLLALPDRKASEIC